MHTLNFGSIAKTLFKEEDLFFAILWFCFLQAPDEVETHDRKPPKSNTMRLSSRIFGKSASKYHNGKDTALSIDYMQLPAEPEEDETEFGIAQPDLPDNVAIKVKTI